MIGLVSAAEKHLARSAPSSRSSSPAPTLSAGPLEIQLAELRRAVSAARGSAMTASLDESADAVAFSTLPDVAKVTSGPLTPDHVIRTKPLPMIVGDGMEKSVAAYGKSYLEYFRRHQRDGVSPLDPAPRWAVWPGQGTVTFGASAADAGIVSDIVRHTRRAIRAAESLGGWQPLGESDLFDVEYWELEQAKLRKGGAGPALQGKIALVTGAASGIGRACAETLLAQGAAVVGLDINPVVKNQFEHPGYLGLACDVTDRASVDAAVRGAVRRFGGLDYLISNAGVFTPSQPLDTLSPETWTRSLDLNLSSHQYLLQAAIPYLRLGLAPAVVFVASKNVPAPGPGAGAYSVAKAGLTQLARVAALELAADGIRVNVIHPHAVFDTSAWSGEVLEQRASSYGITVDEYKAKNLLGVEITSRDVAALAMAMLGPAFAKTTGAQVPIDGGNERVI
jgi:NAD(P)-dependent dehydrogenase (short-subunit alcohol dehydrogenase family)